MNRRYRIRILVDRRSQNHGSCYALGEPLSRMGRYAFRSRPSVLVVCQGRLHLVLLVLTRSSVIWFSILGRVKESDMTIRLAYSSGLSNSVSSRRARRSKRELSTSKIIPSPTIHVRPRRVTVLYKWQAWEIMSMLQCKSLLASATDDFSVPLTTARQMPPKRYPTRNQSAITGVL